MINRISFSGRETMLSAPAEKIASKANEYLSASKIYSEKELSAAEKQVNKAKDAIKKAVSDSYTSPYGQINSVKVGASSVASAENNLSYAISHGTPEQIARENGMGLNLFTSV